MFQRFWSSLNVRNPVLWFLWLMLITKRSSYSWFNWSLGLNWVVLSKWIWNRIWISIVENWSSRLNWLNWWLMMLSQMYHMFWFMFNLVRIWMIVRFRLCCTQILRLWILSFLEIFNNVLNLRVLIILIWI